MGECIYSAFCGNVMYYYYLIIRPYIAPRTGHLTVLMVTVLFVRGCILIMVIVQDSCRDVQDMVHSPSPSNIG